jgi:hypothetical protein
MRDKQRGPATTPDPTTHPTAISLAAVPDKRPGGWPSSANTLRAKWQREHARRTQAYNAIREHLADQPTANAIRAVARRWCRDVLAAADAIANERQDQEQDQ